MAVCAVEDPPEGEPLGAALQGAAIGAATLQGAALGAAAPSDAAWQHGDMPRRVRCWLHHSPPAVEAAPEVPS
jgi:hypothetical protein